MKSNLEDMFKYMKEHNIWEFRIVKLEKMKMLLIGCHDLWFYHDIEIHFTGVQYLACSPCFSADSVRLANEYEKVLIGNNFVDIKSTIILCFEKYGAKRFIVAEKIEYKDETVYHYNREADSEKNTEWLPEWEIHDDYKEE